MPSHQARRDPLPADYQFPTPRPFQEQYDAYDIHRVDLKIVLGVGVSGVDRLVPVAPAPSADATGEP